MGRQPEKEVFPMAGARQGDSHDGERDDLAGDSVRDRNRPLNPIENRQPDERPRAMDQVGQGPQGQGPGMEGHRVMEAPLGQGHHDNIQVDYSMDSYDS